VRIVHSVWSLNSGGLESLLVDLANVQCVSHDSADGTVVSRLSGQVKYICIKRPIGSRNPWYLVKFWFELKAFRPDVIHVHEESFGEIASVLPAPIILTVHDTHRDPPKNANRFAAIVSISKAVKQGLERADPAIRSTIINNGVDPRGIRVKHLQENDKFRVVQVSRLVHEKKGQDLLIEALAHCPDRVGSKTLNLEFIGDGPSREFLERLAAERGLSQKCAFLGELARSEVMQRLADYDLLVQPSRFEGFGLTIVEAMMAGVPVLVSDIEGPAEVVCRGELGGLFRSNDASDLRSQLLATALSVSDSQSTVRTMKAQEYALSNFSIDVISSRYIDLYRKCLIPLELSQTPRDNI